ncbi:hypothetical protein ASG90_14865 [Nocardioides sp. Soil797]|nr:hypothetical protein ASG90_14865 [Nocardioides sp. Soil797]
MTRLSDADYRDHLRTESARFRSVLTSTDPAARVPSCPEWNASDLLGHLTGVHDFWTWIVANRASSPDGYVEIEIPEAYDARLALFDERSAALAAALETADPKEHAWSWSVEQTVGFTLRRQSHEALIHRLDAELAAGDVTELDARLAADGVQEALDIMFGGTPSWGSFTGSGQFVRVDSIDTDHHVWVELGRFTGTDPDDGVTHDEDDIHVVDDPGSEPDAVVSGTAADLDAWLWKRADDTGITVAGERAVHDRFLSCVNHPID